MSNAQAALGESARAMNDLATSRTAFERSLQIERELGPGRRSDLAKAQHNLALVEVAAGDLVQAGRRGAEALATLEEMHGADRPVLIPALVLVGYVARERGDLAASEAYLRRAVAIAERELGPDHYDTANNRIELASTLVRAKRPREAIELLEPVVRSTATTRATAAEARFGLARALVAAGADRERARALAADARDRYRALGEAMAPQAAEIEAWLRAQP
jgi:tetratricopeptide (TPR) repeat protein